MKILKKYNKTIFIKIKITKKKYKKRNFKSNNLNLLITNKKKLQNLNKKIKNNFTIQ